MPFKICTIVGRPSEQGVLSCSHHVPESKEPCTCVLLAIVPFQASIPDGTTGSRHPMIPVAWTATACLAAHLRTGRG